MIEIRFPGGVQVEAVFGGHSVLTDQPAATGGAGEAPSPFDLFLASVATCAGFYALKFCRERGLSTRGLRLTMETERDEAHARVARIRIAVEPPEDFPEKYRAALLRSVSHCAVKHHIEEPPVFEVAILEPALLEA